MQHKKFEFGVSYNRQGDKEHNSGCWSPIVTRAGVFSPKQMGFNLLNAIYILSKSYITPI